MKSLTPFQLLFTELHQLNLILEICFYDLFRPRLLRICASFI